MLSTSSSQYLQPEYIQPLPSSLDVNSSPLALLAQTCSSIGKDTGPPPPSKAGGGGGGTGSSASSDNKRAPHGSSGSGGGGKDSNGTRSKSESPPVGRSVPPLCAAEERSKSRTSGNEKKDSAGHGGHRCSGKGGGGGGTPKPGFRVPPTPSKENSASSSLRGGGDRTTIDSAGGSAAGGETGGRSSRESLLLLQPSVPSSVVGRPVGHGTLVGSGAVSAKSTGGSGNSCSSLLLELNQEALSKSSLHGPMHPLYGSLKDAGGIQALHGSLAPSSLGALPFLGYPLSLDPLAAAAAYSASLAAHCNGLAAAAAAAASAGLGGLSTAQKSSSSSSGLISSTPCSAAAAALPPYASYVRMKTAVGGTTLVPVCKDPYCAHCQVAMHGAAQLAAGGGTTCSGPACGQCSAHGKSSPTSSSSLASPTLAGLPFYAPGVVSSALCSHAAFSSPAGLQGTSPHGGPLVTPYVCNWVQGSEGYCGKRFSSSDDLLQHLRSHTSTAAAVASDGLVSPFHVGLPLSAAAAAMGFPFGGLLGCPTLSPGGLLSAPSSYPRSLSPNSLLSAARYHPYKPPPPLSVLPGATPPGLSGAFPSLAAYYSPYAFYGQRVGAAAAVGP